MQSFLVETRFDGGESCIYCDGTHVVKNGKRKDGIQRYSTQAEPVIWMVKLPKKRLIISQDGSKGACSKVTRGH
jgi:hypothetical protein